MAGGSAGGRGGLLLCTPLLLLLLVACGGELQTPGEALRIFDEAMPEAYLGEPFEAPVRAVGGLRPFEYAVESGELPPGLELDGGIIRGVPEETGSFEFTISVADANLSTTFQEFRLTVTERPPPSVSLVMPRTEVRESTPVRIEVDDAWQLRAVSVRVEWNPEQFELVEGSVSAVPRSALALWESGDDWLQIDLASTRQAWSGELELARFALLPRGPQVPRLTVSAAFVDEDGELQIQGAPATGPAAGNGTAADEDAGAPGTEPTQTEPEPAPASDPESERDSDPGTDTDTDPITDPATDPDTGSGNDPETDPVTDAETGPDSRPDQDEEAAPPVSEEER